MSLNDMPVMGRNRRRQQRKMISPEIFKWSDDFVRAMGWQSKRGAQETLHNEMASQLLKMEQDSFKPGEAEQLRGLDRKAGKHWQRFVAARADMERVPPPRQGKVVEALRQAAQGYIDHFDTNYNKKEKGDQTNQRKRQECLDTLAELRKLDLRDQFVGLGTPTWDSKTAMKGAGLKAALDLESIPGGQCQKLDSDNVNPAFWVKKKQGDGTERTFLFKPGSKYKGDMEGFPPGGEPVREAIVGRTADLLSGMTGIDFNMPETNVVEVGKDRFPDGAIDDKQSTVNGDKVVGSVQQYAPTDGELRDLPRDVMKKISPESCQTIALLDTISLNLDRHSGNLMIGDSDTDAPKVVPIDHGLSMPTPEGLSEIADNLGNDKNVLLKLPGSWEPFGKDMLDKIDQIDPDAYARALKKERDDINDVVPGGGTTLPDESIDMSRRAAMFLKKAAGQLPPALLQVAMGQNAETVLDPTIDDQEFDRRATKAIQDTLGMSAEYKEFLFLMGDEERVEMKSRLFRNGWPSANLRLNERWMMANLKLALAIYKGDMLNPAKEQEVLRHIDRNEMMDRLGHDEPLDTILADVRRRAQSDNKRPLDIDEKALDDVNDCLRVFPATKVKVPPVSDSDYEKVRTVVGEWRNFQAMGGMNALNAAITALSLSPPQAAHARDVASKALPVLRQAESIRNVPPPPADKFDQGAKEKTLSFMETLLPMLPQDDQGHMKRRIDGLRLQVAIAPMQNPGQDVTDKFKDQIADLKDELIEDVRRALTEAVEASVSYMRDHLNMPEEQIKESLGNIRPQIRGGNVRNAGQLLARLKLSYNIP